MKIKIIFLFLLTMTVSLGYSQNSTSKLNNQTKIDLGFGGLGLTLEPKLLSSLTLELSAGIGGYYSISESSFDYYLNPIKPAFYATVSPKWFYNQKKRSLNGKISELNSGNYIGLKIKYASKSFSSKNYSDQVLLYNLHWGMQRAINKNIVWNAYVGGGYGDKVSSTFDTVYPAVGIKLSYIFSQNK